jgi:hypothetical protein
MPEIEVSAEQVARLGDAVGEDSAFLGAVGQVSRLEPWALGPGRSGAALTEVLANWERDRILLGHRLDELAVAAQAAGAAYVQVEIDLAEDLGAGGL